jgi:hypothetical protein
MLVGLVALLGFAMTVNAQRARRGQRASSEPQLPAAVASAVTSAFPDATVGEFEQDTDGGIAVYIVDLSTGPEVEVTADGVIVEVSYDTDMKKVPAAAAQALQKAGAGATLGEVLRVEAHADINGGKVVKLAQPRTEYSAIFEQGGKTGEIRVAADGTIVDPMEWWVED